MDIHLLTAVAKGQQQTAALSREKAIQTLGILKSSDVKKVLIELLEDERVAQIVYDALSKSIYLFDAFDEVLKKHQNKNPWATKLLNAWAKKSWLMQKETLPESFNTTVFKVPYTVTAEMLSPAKAAWSRADISLHAKSCLQEIMPNATNQIQTLKARGYPIAFIANQIDTQKARSSQRQSAVESLVWHIGEPLQALPNQMHRGIVLSQYIDDSFYEIAENRGVLLLTVDTTQLKTGAVITIWPYQAKITLPNEEEITFQVKKSAWQAIWCAESRTEFLLGETLVHKANTALRESFFHGVEPSQLHNKPIGYTLAQKLIKKASSFQITQSEQACTPVLSTVMLEGYQSRTHTTLRVDSVIEHSADLVMSQQVERTNAASDDMILKPRDGRVHAWLNRLLLPDSLSLSFDSYTRGSLGMSLSAVDDKVDEAAMTGCLPIQMPQSILVRFKGKKRSDIQLRDLINAITFFGMAANTFFIKNSELSLENAVLEIEGLEYLLPEEAYEFIESAVIYKTSACTFQFDLGVVIQTIEKNVEWLTQLINARYSNHSGLKRRLEAMQQWLLAPRLLRRDANALYQKTLDISLEDIQEPLLASIQHPTQVSTLSELTQQPKSVDEVWVGSTGLHLDHYRVVAHLLQKHSKPLKARLWLAPPSPIELKQLMEEGYYQIYGQFGVYTEMPEGTLCTQSRFKPDSYVVTTSLRTFSEVSHFSLHGYITSPEMATLTAILGRLPTLSEYRAMID